MLIRVALGILIAIQCVALCVALGGCAGYQKNPCAQYLLSAKSPVKKSGLFVAGAATERPPWQPRLGESFVGAANGKEPNKALLQFQKEPGGASLRYFNSTRIYEYQCSDNELEDR